MRTRVFVIAAAAGVLGAAGALALAQLAGLSDGGTTTVVVERTVSGGERTPIAVPQVGNGFDPAAIYARRASGVVTLYADLGADGQTQGSGFVVDARRHDPDERPRRDQRCRRGRRRRAWGRQALRRVQGSRSGAGTDRRVGSVQRRGGRPRRSGCPPLSPVPLGTSSSVVVGTPVAAIGSPFDEQSSLSVGVVSATDRTIDSLTSGYSVSDAIQTDAPINRGNSGGPLFDAGGRVIGINAQIRSTSGTAEGVGFAIPIDTVRRALDQLLRTGKVSYAYIGVTTQDVTPGLAQKFKFATRRGALVAKVEPDTPAARAGLRGGTRTAEYNGLDISLGGDLIVRIGNRPVASAQDVSRAVTRLAAGQRVAVVVLRGGTTRRVVQVTLAERPA